MKFRFVKKEKIKNLPKESGVYCFKNEKIFYIGKAANIKERVENHFQQPSFKDYLFLNKVKKIGYIKTNSEIEALILEANLIKKYQPKYNVIWKDSKNYFFVGVTKEDFPQIFLTHQKKLKAKSSKLKVEFVGPFVDGKALKKTLRILRKVFPFRSCKKIPKRPCLWYHLNYCPAPCILKSKFIKEIPSNSSKIKKISQKNIKNLIKILKEGKNPVLKSLKRKMKFLAEKQKFEEAAKIRDQIEVFERIMEHSKIFELKTEIKNWPEIEKNLRKILGVKNKISRIEAYDISNIKGKMATGSMITFIDGLPEKNFYRRFKIKFEGKPNDVAMLKEVLMRRFLHKEWEFPSLILIDGGRAQLNAAINVKSQISNVKSKLMALAKKENKLFLEGKKEPILLKELPKEIFNLILKIRDEAHRFAIQYHRKLREKSLLEK